MLAFTHSIEFEKPKFNFDQWTTTGGTKQDVSRMDTDEIYKCIKSIHNNEIEFASESLSEGWLTAFSLELHKRIN